MYVYMNVCFMCVHVHVYVSVYVPQASLLTISDSVQCILTSLNIRRLSYVTGHCRCWRIRQAKDASSEIDCIHQNGER